RDWSVTGVQTCALPIYFAAPLVISIDAGEAVSIIAGVHSGCFELFGNERIRGIADLRGKSVGVQGLGASPHVFLAAMAAHVGLEIGRASCRGGGWSAAV